MLTVNWNTKVVFVPKSYLTDVGGNRFELDMDVFRLDLKAIEATSDEGITFLDIHEHTPEYEISGIIYARAVKIINGYTVEFEDGQYTVRCSGANHNIEEVKVLNSVSIIIGNSAGLTRPVSAQDIDDTVDPDGRLKRPLVLGRSEAAPDLWKEP